MRTTSRIAKSKSGSKSSPSKKIEKKQWTIITPDVPPVWKERVRKEYTMDENQNGLLLLKTCFAASVIEIKPTRPLEKLQMQVETSYLLTETEKQKLFQNLSEASDLASSYIKKVLTVGQFTNVGNSGQKTPQNLKTAMDLIEAIRNYTRIYEIVRGPILGLTLSENGRIEYCEKRAVDDCESPCVLQKKLFKPKKCTYFSKN